MGEGWVVEGRQEPAVQERLGKKLKFLEWLSKVPPPLPLRAWPAFPGLTSAEVFALLCGEWGSWGCSSQLILVLHLSASTKEAPDRHVRYRGGVLAVHRPLCTYAAEPRVCEAGVPVSHDMSGTHGQGRDDCETLSEAWLKSLSLM